MKVLKTYKQKILMFDLDGTILKDDHTINPHTLKAIKKAKASDCLVTVATGRSIIKSLDILEQINVDNYVIAVNGAMLYDVLKKEKIIISDALNLVFKRFFFEFVYENKIDFLVYCEDKNYFYMFNHYEYDPFFTHHDPQIVNLSSKQFEDVVKLFTDLDVYSFTLFAPKFSYQNLKNVFLKYKMDYQFCNYSSAIKDYLDIYHYKTSKAYGLAKLLEYWEMNMKKFYYFGDSDNDVEIMKYVINSVTLQNGCDNVKKVAKTILDGDNNSDALAKYILKIIKE